MNICEYYLRVLSTDEKVGYRSMMILNTFKLKVYKLVMSRFLDQEITQSTADNFFQWPGRFYDIWGDRLFIEYPFVSKENGIKVIGGYQYSYDEVANFNKRKELLRSGRKIYYRLASHSKKRKNIFTKEELLKELSKIANLARNEVIIRMDRVDMDFVEKAHNLLGDKLRLRPETGQEQRRENRINLFLKAAYDYPDKDGDIKHLSPLERVIAAWYLTTKFALPKYEDDQHSGKYYHISRSIYELARQDKDKRMVCVGFTNLFQEFLYRLGIDDTAFVTFSFVSEDKLPNGLTNGHARLLIHLTDPKYNIDGVYLTDAMDDAYIFDKLSVKHLLMSRDEVSKAGNSRRETSNYYDMDLSKGLSGKNDKAEWEIGNSLLVNNPEELYHKPIPKDVLVKAFLAVDHFLDKNLKMSRDNTYSAFELYNMANKLDFTELAQEYGKWLYDEGKSMPLSEVMSYVDLGSNYIGANKMFLEYATKKIDYEKIDDLTYGFYIDEYIDKEKEIDEVDLSVVLYVRPLGEEAISELSKKWKIIDQSGSVVVEFKLHTLDQNKSFEEQLSEINDICSLFINELKELKNNKKNK